MDLKNHIALSVIVSLLYFMFSRDYGSFNLFLTFLLFSSGFFLDLDHLLDLYLEYGRIWLNEKKAQALHRTTSKLYLVFHSYEYNLLFILLSLYLQEAAFLWMAANFTIHLITDNLTNEVHPLAYSLIWRVSIAFDSTTIHKDDI